MLHLYFLIVDPTFVNFYIQFATYVLQFTLISTLCTTHMRMRCLFVSTRITQAEKLIHDAIDNRCIHILVYVFKQETLHTRNAGQPMSIYRSVCLPQQLYTTLDGEPHGLGQ
jgi:hypothetical protein